MTDDQTLLEERRRGIFKIDRLPAMPQVVFRLISELGSDKADAARLEKILESDMALASKVLNLANSAFYGFAQKVTTVRRAVVAVGFTELRLLATGMGLASVFDPQDSPPGWDSRDFWFHSLAVSWIAQELAMESGYPDPGEIMVAGLLHDLGKLILATHLPADYGRLMDLVARGRPFDQAEEELVLAHGRIGFWLARKWNLPGIHAAVIRDHHRPDPEDEFHRPTCLVLLADSLAKGMGLGLVQRAASSSLDQALEGAGSISRESLQNVVHKAASDLPAVLDGWRNNI